MLQNVAANFVSLVSILLSRNNSEVWVNETNIILTTMQEAIGYKQEQWSIESRPLFTPGILLAHLRFILCNYNETLEDDQRRIIQNISRVISKATERIALEANTRSNSRSRQTVQRWLQMNAQNLSAYAYKPLNFTNLTINRFSVDRYIPSEAIVNITKNCTIQQEGWRKFTQAIHDDRSLTTQSEALLIGLQAGCRPIMENLTLVVYKHPLDQLVNDICGQIAIGISKGTIHFYTGIFCAAMGHLDVFNSNISVASVITGSIDDVYSCGIQGCGWYSINSALAYLGAALRLQFINAN